MTTAHTRGLRSAAVRRGNLATILDLIHLRGSVSRSHLVSYSGLTRSAIGGLVADLTELGLVREEQSSSQGKPGRPSTSVVPRSDTNVALSVVVMVDSIVVSAFGLGGMELAVSRAVPRAGWLVDETLEAIFSLISDVRSALPSGSRIFGVGVAVPGLVRHADECVVIAPNLEWHDVPLGLRLGEFLGGSIPVLVRNEANVGALAEVLRGSAIGHDHVLYLSGEVGVGAGIISDRLLVTGGSGFAGEVGHMHVNSNGRSCRCGATGCWESEVGEHALLARAGVSEVSDPNAVEQLVRRAAEGDRDAEAAIGEHGRWVGIGLSSLINILNPEVVVFGGVFAQTFELMRPAMEVELADRSLRAIRERCILMASSLGPAALPLGAAELVWDLVLEDPGRAVLRSIPGRP